MQLTWDSLLKQNHTSTFKDQENLLSKLYDITCNLKTISGFDALLEYTLDSFVDIAEADGGILCLYNNSSSPEAWEYKLINGISKDDKDYDIMMDVVQETFLKGNFYHYKQPDLAALYDCIVSFPLSVHNKIHGVILLFTKCDSHHIFDRELSLLKALCNQTIVIIDNFRYKSLTESHEAIRRKLRTPQLFSNIIGKSERMQLIYDVIEKIKFATTTVILEGQSGTGKDLIAKTIHYRSITKNKKFIPLNCGTLNEFIFDSDLVGQAEFSSIGTLFLYEIQEASLITQSKLLKFLRDLEEYKKSSNKAQIYDARVICATNVPLKEKTQKGEFLINLYYRLNVIKITVPPLSQRKSDIPLLAIHFLDIYNKKMRKTIKGLTDETMKTLCNYYWPGNVGQLENEIERAAILVEEGEYIKPSDLSTEVCNYSNLNYQAFQQENAFEILKPLREVVHDTEKSIILTSLIHNDWNQTKTAEDLGLSRQGLIKKMIRYHLYK